MVGDSAERAYKARALAQAHPLTPLANRFRQRAVAQEEQDQPMAELARWAGEALLKGYCLRRVEEQLVADEAGTGTPEVAVATESEERREIEQADLEVLEAEAAAIQADLRAGDPGPHLLGDASTTFEALDRIITSELSSRHDNYRSSVDAASWRQFEEYIAWWAVRGYAMRVAEAALGAAP
jgi:hypothetical protein